MKVVLKELKETGVCLKLIFHQKLIENEKLVTDLRNECEEMLKLLQRALSPQIITKKIKKKNALIIYVDP